MHGACFTLVTPCKKFQSLSACSKPKNIEAGIVLEDLGRILDIDRLICNINVFPYVLWLYL